MSGRLKLFPLELQNMYNQIIKIPDKEYYIAHIFLLMITYKNASNCKIVFEDCGCLESEDIEFLKTWIIN